MKRFPALVFPLAAAALIAPALFAADWAAKGVKVDPPSLVANGGNPRASVWAQGFNALWPELFSNLKNPRTPFATRYVQPGPSWPDAVYLWDTAFISEVWRNWDPDTAMEINLPVLDQAKNGRLQHSVGPWDKTDDTQPPVMAWSIWRKYEAGAGIEYLRRCWPTLVAYNQWLYEHRRHPSGLFFWVHPFESGMDNSPRFTNRDVSKMSDMRNLAAIDLSSYLVLQNRTLAKMAREFGLSAEAAEYDARAEELRALIEDRLWDEETGLYYDRDLTADRLIKIKSIASLLPLFCGVPDPARAERLLAHIKNPAEFDTPLPLPSVARDEPSFELDMWRGPVWINTTYMVVVGLCDYGHRRDAAVIAFRTVDRVYREAVDGRGFIEYYDPEQPGTKRLHRKTDLGRILRGDDKPRPHFAGWTGLVNNLFLETLIGLDPAGKKLCPSFPPEAAGMAFRLDFPARRLDLRIEVGPGGVTSGQADLAGRSFAFRLGDGECVELK